MFVLSFEMYIKSKFESLHTNVQYLTYIVIFYVERLVSYVHTESVKLTQTSQSLVGFQVEVLQVFFFLFFISLVFLKAVS